MKKIINFLLISMCIVLLSSCYQDLKKDSLDEYILQINQNKIGFSSVEIDHPDYFLPSLTFIQDYDYIDAKYYWREDDPLRGLFTSNIDPEISFLCLKYEEATYYIAKEFVLNAIIPYDNKFYVYNGYVFYENSNFINLQPAPTSRFPEYFTMACYNDVSYTLIFIGFHSGTLAGPSCLEEKYIDGIDNNWGDFLNQYYGQCYNFNEQP